MKSILGWADCSTVIQIHYFRLLQWWLSCIVKWAKFLNEVIVDKLNVRPSNWTESLRSTRWTLIARWNKSFFLTLILKFASWKSFFFQKSTGYQVRTICFLKVLWLCLCLCVFACVCVSILLKINPRCDDKFQFTWRSIAETTKTSTFCNQIPKSYWIKVIACIGHW